jgi:hypothetical protein
MAMWSTGLENIAVDEEGKGYDTGQQGRQDGVT